MRHLSSTVLEPLFYMTRGSCFKALRLLTFLSLISVFCTPVAWALGNANSCAQVLASEYALGGRLVVQADAAELAESASVYAEIIKNIDATLAPLVVPKETKIEIGDAYAVSGFDGADFSVYVGVRPLDFMPFAMTANRNILVHEYGHAVFEKNLLVSSPEYRAMREYGMKLEANTSANDALLRKLRKDGVTDEPLTKAKNENGRLKKLYADFSKLMLIRYAYHEVFADTLLWAHTKDPKAVRTGVENLAKPVQPYTVESLLMRDFNDGLDGRNVQLWKENIYKHVFLLNDFYFAFLPIRWEIWSLSKNKIHDEKYRKELPAKVFNILLKNFVEDLKQSPQELGPSGLESVERLNEKIIRDLRQTI